MKTITVNGVSVGIAVAVLLAVIGVTWAAARSKANADTSSLRKQIAVLEKRISTQAAEHAKSMREVNATMAERERELVRVEQLKNENEKLREASENKDREIAALKEDESRGGGRGAHKTAAAPVQKFEVGLGEERDLIPGVLSVKVDALQGNSADVLYGGHMRHVKVGEKVGIGYLGRRCLLGLAKIQGSGDEKKASFSFSVMEPNRWRGRSLATTRDADE
ncbi:hypothetical protein BH20VER3_BH20VER3_11910 [soil metagenome]